MEETTSAAYTKGSRDRGLERENSVGGDDKILVENPEQLKTELASVLEPIGLDVHPFLVGWYNEKVGPKFQLNYPYNTVGFVIINGPDVFEKCILPYVRCRMLEDPNFTSDGVLDDSMKHAFTIVKRDLWNEGLQTDVYHDFELFPSRRPKVLVQTAAHVAGAVQYLHSASLPKQIQEERFSKKSNFNGVAIHPKYGGWFAIRGVFIFTNVVPGLEFQKPEPVQIFKDEAAMADVIELFAYKWQSHEWRNVHKGLGQKYSDNFMKYLNLESSKRWNFVKDIISESCE